MGSAGLNPSGRALVADSVLGMGMIAAATWTAQNLAFVWICMAC